MLTTEEFIDRSRQIFGDFYDYTKTDLSNKDEKNRVCIICLIHGEFMQRPYSHLKGCGCYKCGKIKTAETQSFNTEYFIRKAKQIHGDKYDYSETIYTKSTEKVDIICPKHGKFKQMAYSHLNGHGCHKCSIRANADKMLSNKDGFIEKAKKIHGEKYDYSKVEYKGAKIPINIICENGHSFWQMPNKHLIGHGCPYCRESKMETEISQFLTENNIEFIQQKTFDWLKDKKKLRLDFFLPEYNVGIECQGIQHFQDSDFGGKYNLLEGIQSRDLAKKKLCNEHGVKLLYYANYQIEFPYHVYTDKNELLKNLKLFAHNNLN